MGLLEVLKGFRDVYDLLDGFVGLGCFGLGGVGVFSALLFDEGRRTLAVRISWRFGCTPLTLLVLFV